MHPEQIALIARRNRSAELEILTYTAGDPLYEKRLLIPKDGFKPSVSRHVRVFQHPNGMILVEETQMWTSNRIKVLREVHEADSFDDGRAHADAFIGRPIL